MNVSLNGELLKMHGMGVESSACGQICDLLRCVEIMETVNSLKHEGSHYGYESTCLEN